MPLPSVEQFIGTNVTEQGFKDAQKQLVEYVGNEVPKKVDTDADFATKANKATTLAGYGIADAYTKAQVDSSIAAVSGGHKAYQTLALAQAAQATLPVNSIVEITNDGANNGTYQWNGTTLTKSAYDPLVQGMAYTDQEIDKIPVDTLEALGLLYAIVDPDGKTAPFSRIGLDGNPDYFAAESIFNAIKTRIVNEISAKGLKSFVSENFAFQVVDMDGKRSWIESTDQGLPSAWSIQCIIDGLTQQGFNPPASPTVPPPTTYKSTYQDTERQIVSGLNIRCDGDSMTAGTGATEVTLTTYPARLKTKLSELGKTANVINQGVGGETSTTIAARVGGYPITVIIDDGVLPATTDAVRVTLKEIGGHPIRPLLQNSNMIYGMINNIPVKISVVKPNGGLAWDDANYYTISRRTASETATIINRPAPFYSTISKDGENDIHIIWVGQNNPEASPDRAIADARAIINSLKPLEKRYVVMSRAGGNFEQDADDVLFLREFGKNFIPIRQYMVDYGLADAGLTPTSADLIDIANRTTPVSLRQNSGTVHGNDYYYDIVAQQVLNKLIELEYI